jgi:aryl-alcohol dehydrogenase-like predicted oxidoreductase
MDKIWKGTWSSDGKGWGTADRLKAEAAQHQAFEQGIMTDCAQVYGEQLIARVIDGQQSRFRHLIATKVGTFFAKNDSGPFTDNTPETLRRHVEDSLRRLSIDCIELVQVHWPDAQDPQQLSDQIGTLLNLKADGKLNKIGVCNFGINHLRALEAAGLLEEIYSNQIPFNPFEQGYLRDGTIAFCHKYDIKLLAYSPLARGVLGGRSDKVYPPDDMRHNTEDSPAIDPLFRTGIFTKLRSIIEATDIDPLVLAIQFAMHNGLTPIVGARTPTQLRGAINASSESLSAEQIKIVQGAISIAGINVSTKPEFMRPHIL